MLLEETLSIRGLTSHGCGRAEGRYVTHAASVGGNAHPRPGDQAIRMPGQRRSAGSRSRIALARLDPQIRDAPYGICARTVGKSLYPAMDHTVGDIGHE
jgi:hypothetical protein